MDNDNSTVSATTQANVDDAAKNKDDEGDAQSAKIYRPRHDGGPKHDGGKEKGKEKGKGKEKEKGICTIS